MSASSHVAAQGPGGPRPAIAKLASRDIVQVIAELSDLLDAGCPLSRALGVLLRQAKKPPEQARFSCARCLTAGELGTSLRGNLDGLDAAANTFVCRAQSPVVSARDFPLPGS